MAMKELHDNKGGIQRQMSTESLPLGLDEVFDMFGTVSPNLPGGQTDKNQNATVSNASVAPTPANTTATQASEADMPSKSASSGNRSSDAATATPSRGPAPATTSSSDEPPQSQAVPSPSEGTASREADTVEERYGARSRSVPEWRIPDSDSVADWIRSQMVLTPQLLRELQPELTKPLKEVYDHTDNLIQHADGRSTGKGYDTTGYEDQFIFDRLNELFPLGRANYRISYTITREVEIITANDKKQWDIGMNMVVEIGNPVIFPDGECRFIPILVLRGPGGAINKDYSNALKGAYTNAFKRCLAELGPGREAFSGELAEEFKKQVVQGQTDQSQRNAGSGYYRGSNGQNKGRNTGNASSDSSNEPLKYADDKTPILTFGQYAGKSVYYIYKNHPDYLVWLATQCKRSMHPELQKSITLLYSHYLKKQGEAAQADQPNQTQSQPA